MKRTLIFDTETTALISNSLMSGRHQPHVVEFYGQIVDENDQVIESLEFLAKPPHLPPNKDNKPPFFISDEIRKITGLTDDDVKDAEPFAFYAEQVAGIIGRADSVVAHNLSYDYSVISIEMDRIKRSIEWPLIRICTVEETEYLKGFRLSLSALHDHLFSEPFAGAHRARVDVAALTRCFCELRARGVL